MATTLKLALDVRRTKMDGTSPIVLILIHNRHNVTIPTGYYISQADWDPVHGQIKPSCKLFTNVGRINNTLQKKKTEVFDIINKLDDNGELQYLTVAGLKDKITGKNSEILFGELTKRLIAEFKQTHRLGTASVYEQGLNMVMKFTNGRDVPLRYIDYQFIKTIETDFLGNGNSINGLSFYTRTIRAILNKAIKEGIGSPETYPFNKYTIRKEETRKRAISKIDIEKIESLKLEPYTFIWDYWNYFLFSFYMRGLNFTDMAKLKMDNIVEGRILYRRSKTSGLFSIKITGKAQKILDIYTKGKAKEDYIFPVIHRNDPEGIMLDIENARRLYNRKLKIIGNMAGIPVPLSSYVARHTWASTAKRMGFSTEVISEALGHKDLKTTQIYLDSFENKVIDDANDAIIN